MGVIKNKYIGNYRLTMLSICIWVLFTLFCSITIVNHTNLVIEISCIYIIAVLFPFLILSGLYGYLISMITFVICFLVCLIVNSDKAYTMSVFLIAMFCYSLFSQYFW